MGIKSVAHRKGTDCLEMLRVSSISDLFKREWNAQFNFSLLHEAVNARLKDAIESMPVAGDYDRKVLLLLVRQMTRDMNACFDFNSLEYADVHSYQAVCPDGKISSEDLTCLMNSMDMLVKEGIAVAVTKFKEDSDDEQELEGYMLSVNSTKKLLKGRDKYVNYNKISERATVIRHADIQRKELYFPTESRTRIDELIHVLMPENYGRTREILNKNGRRELVSCLLYGPPGTGKTESAKQIAAMTGRDLFLVDISRLNGSRWGASEKNYKALFRDYSYIAALSACPPILFLNEADQILSKRIVSMDSAIDRAENTVTNIVLQGVEDMEGVLMATTNLAGNLDSAFDRRFLIKIELPNPDESARFRIWKNLLNDEISDDECRKLAETYLFSGAQISNVVTKRAMAELFFDGDRGFEYINRLCLEEPLSESATRPHKKIGF